MNEFNIAGFYILTVAVIGLIAAKTEILFFEILFKILTIGVAGIIAILFVTALILHKS